MNSDQRLFFVMNSLIKDSITIPEIMRLYKDAYNCNCKHRDISNDIKKLQECGFVISKEKVKNNNSFLYRIDKTIFHINLSNNEIDFIRKLFIDYKNNLDIIRSIFEKFSYIANVDIEEILEIKKTKPDNDLYDKIKSLILKAIKEKRKVRFYYDPINASNQTLKTGFPCHINEDDKKIERFYLLTDSEVYIEINFNRIVSLPEILYETNNFFPQPEKAVFKLFYPVSKSYNLIHTIDKELERTEDYLVIETSYFTLFRLLQRLSKYGDKIEIISPKEAREKMIEQLEKSLMRYHNS